MFCLDLSQHTEYDENMHVAHNVTTPKETNIQLNDTHSDSRRSTLAQNKIPIGSCFRTTNDTSYIDGDMLYIASTTSSINADRGLHAKKPHIATVVEGRGCEVEASTSPSLVTVANCSKNRRNKARYKYVQRCGQRQNCQPTKTLPTKRRKEQHKYRQYDSMIQPICDKVKEILISCQSSAKECGQAVEMTKRLLRQSWIEKFWQQWILQQTGIQISQSEDNAAVLLSHALRQNGKVSTTTQTQGAYSCTPRPGNVKSTKSSTESARPQSSSLASALGLAKYYIKPQCQLFSFIQSENVRENTSKEVSAKTIPTSTRSSIYSSFQSSTATKNSSFQNYTHRLPAVRMARTKQTAI